MDRNLLSSDLRLFGLLSGGVFRTSIREPLGRKNLPRRLRSQESTQPLPGFFHRFIPYGRVERY